MGLRDEILAKDDLPREKVAVPEWGIDALWVGVMSGRERDKFDTSFGEQGVTLDNIRARLVVFTACDETGQRIFSDADIAPLGAKSSAALDRIYSVALRLNKLRKTDVDDLSKNC